MHNQLVWVGAPGGIRIRGPGRPRPPAINGFPCSVNPKGRYAKPGYTTGAVSCHSNSFFYLLPGTGSAPLTGAIWAQWVILNPRNSPAASSHVTSTLTTFAPGGPILLNRKSSSTLDLSPSAMASTRPSRRFLTHPTTPRCLARLVSSFLKRTP